MSTRPPPALDLSRNYPLSYRVLHRKSACAAGEPFGYIGFGVLTEEALQWRYWEALCDADATTMRTFFKDLDRARLVDDGDPDAVSLEVAEFLRIFDALHAFAENPSLEWRHDHDFWEETSPLDSAVRQLCKDLRPHRDCAARISFMKHWHW